MSLADALINHDLHQEGFLLSDCGCDLCDHTVGGFALQVALSLPLSVFFSRTVGSISPLGVDAEDDTVTD